MKFKNFEFLQKKISNPEFELGEEIFQLEDIEEANMLGGIIFLSQAFADLDYSENISPIL